MRVFYGELKNILRLLLPSSRAESYLLVVVTVFYFLFGLYISLNTSIIYNPELGVDIYFSYDNSLIYRRGYENIIGHPLMVFITYPFIFIGNCIAAVLGDLTFKTVFLALICSLLISSSVLYINRYLREIIQLRKNISYLITFLYVFMSTNLILSFTPESFTISSFLLCFVFYYYSKSIQEQKDVPFSVNLIFAALIGGVTITNAAKAVVPMLYLKRKPKTLIRQILIILCFFIVVYLLLWLFTNQKITFLERVSRFRLESDNICYYITDLFLGAPMFFPEMNTVYYGHSWGEITDIQTISLDVYHYWWQYLFVGIIFILMIASVIFNYRNKYVQMIALCFGVDIVIHIIIRYGLADPFIYGAHWIFCVPLLLGWLYKSMNKNLERWMLVLLCLLFVALLINNLYRIKEFVTLATSLFPPVS